MISTDIYTITNPALGSFVLWSFLQGYDSKNKKGCPYILLFLPLPMVLSENIRNDFRGTNSATGLYTWVSRNQKSLLRLSEKVEKTSSISKEAVMFGVENKILQFQDDGTLIAINKGLIMKKMNSLSDELKEIASASRKLGKWMSEMESSSSILISLGLFYEKMEHSESLSL
ncbi:MULTISPECIES: three component ABC system middle component [unclassified Paenibacillus]|uniref:three component ABC system middle component n=1 Tax=unclassified Paenibacillus TaxID=185978 RepID=UPI0009A5F22A|nr:MULTISPECIES: three component ABC system middle component [unclassified Paenibacillus]SLJ92896.1 hypothetical protein SAMN06272722_1011185 [Paenibacillus sp. RU5A]SOC58464.1 hypothetical protein SAMN05880581_1015 [Paenibacillus sp. RU26A]SOC67516.1 hypothetical protein SAMN05880586_1015 [Paenibacillus sp. RU5M]